MTAPPTITVLMDLPPGQEYASATVAALNHAAAATGADIRVRVLPTDQIDDGLIARPGAGIVVGPGSPYRNPDAVREVIRSARERGVPLVGT